MKRCFTTAAWAVLLGLFLAAAPAGAGEHDSLGVAKALSSAYADVAEKVVPAVVSIRSERKVKLSGPRVLPFGDDDSPLTPEDLMRRFFENRSRGGKELEQRVPGMGSGIILDREGHILTNNHVVEDADRLEVQLSDERTFTAEVVGTDPKTDLAVIKLTNHEGELPLATIGDSDRMRVGNIVMAIGSPFYLRQTVTTGIISARDRSIVDPTFSKMMYQNFIQTDASINPGNSGGPLVNLDGEVIGINTAIRSGGGGSDGVGFAVPINQAKNVVRQLIEKGKVTRGWLGVGIQDLTPELAAQFPNVQEGVLVREVFPETPAGQAGLQAGDVIVRYNGQRVTNSRELQNNVAATDPGTKVPMAVVRKGETVVLDVTPGVQPEDLMAFADGERPAPQKPGTAQSEKLGLTVQTLDDTLREQFGLEKNEKGVVITEVDPDGAAARVGLQSGALILEIDHKTVADAQAFEKIAKDLGGKSVLVFVREQRSNRYVVIKLD